MKNLFVITLSDVVGLVFLALILLSALIIFVGLKLEERKRRNRRNK